MKAVVLCCFAIAFLVVLCEGQNQCGSKCSPAQICERGKCVCTPIRCLIFCPFGFKRDEIGCEYPCTCAMEGENPPQKLCESECSPAQVCKDGKCVCTPIRCFIHCPFGFKRDENGCEYPCTCAMEGESPKKRCGQKYCTGAQVCEKEKCECSKIRCAIACLFGFKVDENGCEYPCTCAEKPPVSGS